MIKAKKYGFWGRQKDNKSETCFIELNHAQELAKNLDAYKNENGHPSVVSGKFEDNIEYLLNNKTALREKMLIRMG